ncbi:hypothetical protein [Kocuria sp. SM24M-10]|uniref:hypothetical protein n=1 Tax=Kocuria sp. SM24M-10 TaxID=1660349 RepID=UPI000ABBB196|nr:hypothetical protein [Kocuria sp. SM24M-10]
MRRALHVHRLSTYLVFQALTPVLALGYAAVLSPGGWSGWVLCWAVLMGVGLVWTQLVWGPCWAAGADYGLAAGIRVPLMSVAGAALMLPFLILNVVLDPVWFLYVLVFTPYGVVAGLLGGVVLAVRDRGVAPFSHTHNAVEASHR